MIDFCVHTVQNEMKFTPLHIVIPKDRCQMKRRNGIIKQPTSRALFWGIGAFTVLGAAVIYAATKKDTKSADKKEVAQEPSILEDEVVQEANIPSYEQQTAQDQGIDQEEPQEKTIQQLILEQKALTNDNRILVIGDSQVGRNIEAVIKEDWDPVLGLSSVSWYKEGTNPAKILKNIAKQDPFFLELTQMLSEKFPIIFIQLGDNAINTSSEVSNLLQMILSNYEGGESPLIIWSGPFPICLPNNKSTAYVKAPPCEPGAWNCLPQYQEMKRTQFTPKIASAIRDLNNEKIIFISPYDSPVFPTSGRKACFTSDGIHLLRPAARQYLNNLLTTKVNKEG